MSKKFIILFIIIVVLGGAFKYYNLEDYVKVMGDDSEVKVTVSIEDSQAEKEEITETYQRMIRFIINEKVNFNSDKKPDGFDKVDLSKDFLYDINIDGQEYIYKPSMNVVAKKGHNDNEYTYGSPEGIDKAILNVVVS